MKQSCGEAERLERSGLKKTRRREDVMRVLENSERPCTAEEVFLALKERGADISLSTVYRALDALLEKGIVRKAGSDGSGRAVFELNRSVHRHYLVCLGCHKMIPMEKCPLGGLEKRLERETGFSVTGHSLEIYGYCRECRAQMTSGKKNG